MALQRLACGTALQRTAFAKSFVATAKPGAHQLLTC